MGKFCDIPTRNELADFLQIPRKKLAYILFIKKVDAFYKEFEISKKDGGSRHIKAPTTDLKVLQQKLSAALWIYQKSIWNERHIQPNISHAFEKKKSIISNAKIHRNKRFVMNFDLENFFDSFHFGRVRGFFKSNRDFNLPIEVATTIAQITCYKGHLPQGASSSPIITNLMCQILDAKILKIAKKYKLDYTRYADDMTFSTNNKLFLAMQSDFVFDLSKEIKAAGFSINNKKTRLQFRDSKQVVTGLVVNKKLSVDHRYCRETKAMAHHLYTQGCFKIDGTGGSVAQLEGRFSFINQLDRYNNKLDRLNGINHSFRELSGREKQYQKFLFYKYFFANENPLVVTEGKTDIAYIKAALKNLYADYPKLIEKTSGGKFEFKISFFKRTKRLTYFFGIVPDGADTMKNMYNYFTPQSNNSKIFPSYLTEFSKLCSRAPEKPIFFVFDNEIQNKHKPLAGFANHVKLSEEQRETLKSQLHIKLIEIGNLFVLTNPLVGELIECEIEDLFDEKALAVTIGGKTFSRKDDGSDQYYSKAIFSQYITKNYKTIDFNGFRKLLDAINSVVESYSL